MSEQLILKTVLPAVSGVETPLPIMAEGLQEKPEQRQLASDVLAPSDLRPEVRCPTHSFSSRHYTPFLVILKSY